MSRMRSQFSIISVSSEETKTTPPPASVKRVIAAVMSPLAFLLKAGIKRLVLRKLRLHIGHKRSRDIVDLRGDGDGVRHADALEPPDGLILGDLQLVRRADHRQFLLEGDDLIADLKAHVQHLLREAENAARAAFDLHAGDERAFAGTADEEALLLQLLERHAHGRAADAEGVL